MQVTGTPTHKAARGAVAQTAKWAKDICFRQSLIQQLRECQQGACFLCSLG